MLTALAGGILVPAVEIFMVRLTSASPYVPSDGREKCGRRSWLVAVGRWRLVRGHSAQHHKNSMDMITTDSTA